MAIPERHVSSGQPRTNGLSLFWRTFFLLSAFLMGSVLAWVQTDRSRLDQSTGNTWMLWLLLAVTLSLAGLVWMSRLINLPLQQLSFATSRVREGDFEASTLDESVTTSEIRDVNVGFNRMTQKLAKIEQDRAVMLAGISHDLRTPLGRLRLEIELSVTDPKVRDDMVSDISQLDAIIDKFLDYARPCEVAKNSVSLCDNMEACVRRFTKSSVVQFTLAVPPHLWVQADPVELQRVIDNLLDNAAHYGKSPDTGIANIDLSAKRVGKTVLLQVRDHGIGVSATQIGQLTTPFFRGEAARTAANGTGLGLAIVEKIVSRMGGTLEFSQASKGGLCVAIGLPAA